MPLLEVNNLKKIYTTRFGGQQCQALSQVNFSVEEGEYVAIVYSDRQAPLARSFRASLTEGGSHPHGN